MKREVRSKLPCALFSARTTWPKCTYANGFIHFRSASFSSFETVAKCWWNEESVDMCACVWRYWLLGGKVQKESFYIWTDPNERNLFSSNASQLSSETFIGDVCYGCVPNGQSIKSTLHFREERLLLVSFSSPLLSLHLHLVLWACQRCSRRFVPDKRRRRKESLFLGVTTPSMFASQRTNERIRLLEALLLLFPHFFLFLNSLNICKSTQSSSTS